MVSVVILGCSSTRYTFNKDYANKFTILKFIESMSPLAQVGENHINKFDQFLENKSIFNNWKETQILYDVKKNIVNAVRDLAPDYLVIDLVPVLENIIEISSELNNKCAKKYTAKCIENNKEIMQWLSDNVIVSKKTILDYSEEELVNSIRSYANELLKSLPASKIILIETYLSEKYEGPNGILTYENSKEIQIKNNVLKKMYEEFKKMCGCRTIPPYLNSISTVNHPYGLSKTSFKKQYYDYIYQNILNIVENKDVVLPHKKNQKVALVRDCFDPKNKIESLSENTGNIAFWSSIERLFDAELLPSDFYKKDMDTSKYDAIILTNFIWIRRGADYSKLYDMIYSIKTKIILMSVGLQAFEEMDDFELHESVIKILKHVEKQSTIGVRGEYTAKILKKHGITNICVIGCPSMYYHANRDFKIDNTINYPHYPISNFKTFYGKMSKDDLTYLHFLQNNNIQLVEQTKLPLLDSAVHTNSDKGVVKYINSNKIIFYDEDLWCKFLSNYSLSFGLRFHGNVLALRAGIKALFVTIDTRTREMTEYFHLPTVDLKTINKCKNVSEIANLADYTEFNSSYAALYDKFVSFVNKNGLKIVAEPLHQITKKNKMIVTKIDVFENKIIYEYKIEGIWSESFNGQCLEITYSQNVSDTPYSIAVIPLLGSILPLSWLYDAEIYVDEIDKNFLNCIKDLKQNYSELYPSLYFGGSISTSKIVQNKNCRGSNKHLLLFSGGVDATCSLSHLIDLKPDLFTIHGADIFFSKEDNEGMKIKLKKIKEISSSFKLNQIVCKSGFRTITKTMYKNDPINLKVANKYGNYWHEFMHGLALITQCAPISYLYNYRYIHIAASHNSKTPPSPCASLPQFDEVIKFSNAHVFHDGFGKTRMDKIRSIIEFKEEYDVKIPLHVCWQQRDGNNCCLCEKCMRTLVALLIYNQDPTQYGFEQFDNKKNEIIDALKTKINRGPYWTDLVRQSEKNNIHNDIIDALQKIFASK